MKISYSNLKGRTGAHDLAAVNVVVGQNFAGKSTVLTALRLALLGYDPALGRTNQATWQLASGSQMTVELEGIRNDVMRPGTVYGVTRHWSLSGKSVKAGGSVVSIVPDLLIDVRAFFAKTARERSAYIMGLVPLPDAAIGASALNAAVADHADDEVREFVEFWIGERQERDTPAGQWLAEMIASAEVRAKDAKAGAAEAEATVRRFLGAEDEALEDVSKDLEACQAEIRSLAVAQAMVRAARAGAEARAKALEDVRRCDEALTKAKAALEGVSAWAGITKEEAVKAQTRCQLAGLDLSVFRDGKERVVAQMRELKDSGKCPTCGGKPPKKLAGELKKQLATLEKNIESALSVGSKTGQVCERFATYQSVKESVRLAEQQVAEARERLGRLPEPATVPVDPSAALAAAKERLTELGAAQNKFEARKERKRLMAQAETDATVKRDEAVRWAKVTKALADVREKAVAQAFDGFAAKVRRFTDGILPFELRVREGEVGCFRGGLWVSHEVLSGSEMALVYAGLAVALAESAPVKIVMVDEVLLSPDTKGKVARRMNELAAAGVIDAFVCVDVTKDGWPADSVNFVEL